MINPFRDVNWNPSTAERRSFALFVLCGLPAVALIFMTINWIRERPIPDWTLWLAGTGVALGGVLWLLPQLARPFYLTWYFVGCCIGIVVSNTLLAAFYYLVVTPIGVMQRLFGRDPMRRRPAPKCATYWTDCEKVVDRNRYFRQF